MIFLKFLFNLVIMLKSNFAKHLVASIIIGILLR